MSMLAPSAGVVAGLGATRPLWAAAAVTAAFTLLARWVRGVSPAGAVAGAAVCFLLYAGAGTGAFAALVTVFSLTWATTRLGYSRKQRLGIAEQRDGRTASQVLANLAVAAGCAGLAAMTQSRPAFLLAAAAALAEAAADTVSSEVGQARSDSARLITTWEEVPAGTDGGVSWAGSLAGIAAATLVSLVCVAGRLTPTNSIAIVLPAAIMGMVIDSYFGALLERRKILNNDWVNFIGTLTAAAVGFLFAQ